MLRLFMSGTIAGAPAARTATERRAARGAAAGLAARGTDTIAAADIANVVELGVDEVREKRGKTESVRLQRCPG
jgi:hypothetical protein